MDFDTTISLVALKKDIERGLHISKVEVNVTVHMINKLFVNHLSIIYVS
jgi:hypothetical protein